jgi:aryl-alcohol dehydrogenase-like predicted oxidoreductase
MITIQSVVDNAVERKVDYIDTARVH